MNPINDLIGQAIAAGSFDGSPISRLAPYIEQMGTRLDAGAQSYRKEFWWEREWRRAGNVTLPNRVIVLCPEAEFAVFQQILDDHPLNGDAAFVDPRWGLEQIISRLSGYVADESDIL
jgi:hypothetical protein